MLSHTGNDGDSPVVRKKGVSLNKLRKCREIRIREAARRRRKGVEVRIRDSKGAYRDVKFSIVICY